MNIFQNKLVVISGCSGGGKSTLISELSNEGYSVIPEVGRELVKEQLKINSNILPWKEPTRFCEILIERSVAAYHKASKITSAKEQIIFLDRCFLEGVSYYQNLKMVGANKYDHFIHELRYYSTIFIVPPWKEIFCGDDERKHSFEKAVEEYERDCECYVKYGYQLVEIPKISVKERCQFVISMLNKEILMTGGKNEIK